MAQPAKKIEWALNKSNTKKDGSFVEDLRLRMDQTFAKKPALMQAGLGLELTPLQQEEWVKCALDVVYFVENYYRITTIDRGFILFEPFEFQKEMLQAFQDNRFTILATSRQAGKTTVAAAFLLWFVLFHPDKEVAILANKERQAREIMDRMQKALQDLPFFLQSGLEKYGTTEMAFENGSKVFVYATSPDAIRGRSCSLVYLDEFAFVDGDEEFWESVYPTLASGSSSRCIITSTPKGQRGMFYALWQGADPDENGNTNGFFKKKVTWQDVPHYANDPTFEESTRARLGDSRFLQEFCVEFRGSVGTLIPSQLLMAMRSKEVTELNEFTKVLYEYNPDHSYVAIGDVGGGLEQDYSVLTIFDVTEIPYKIAAKYRCNTISPLLFPFTMVDMCNHYGQCPLLVETNNDVGGQAITVLWYDLEYLETIMTSNDPKRGGSGTRVGGKGAKPGIKTTSRVRNIGCSNLKGLIETGKLEIEDMDTIDELSTFILKNDKYQADEGCHDDCVMTLVLFSWLVKQDWFEDLYSVNVSQEMKKTASEKAIEALIPFGGTGAMGSQPVVRRQTGGLTTLEGSTSQMNEWAKS